ncbi:MAG TPA: DUF305 domain-containing protein [Terriglobales bacterium]|nr:DUF305 domain-containing protein [Terriglobales bacterium]
MTNVKRLIFNLATVIVLLCTTVSPQNSTGESHTAAWVSLMESMHKMHAAVASVNQSDSADLDFVRLMLPHHQAAIDMAKTQLLYGKDPQMRRLAQEIIADQQSEIDLMQLWLKQTNSKQDRSNQK